jgi:dGTPase
MIDHLVTDVIETSRSRIDQAEPASIDAVRNHDRALIALSPELQQVQLALKQFLRGHLYTHPRVERMTRRAHTTISALFEAFSDDFDLMPEEHAARARRAIDESGRSGAMRAIADYIAGMTDRFALQQYARVTGSDPESAPLLN